MKRHTGKAGKERDALIDAIVKEHPGGKIGYCVQTKKGFSDLIYNELYVLMGEYTGGDICYVIASEIEDNHYGFFTAAKRDILGKLTYRQIEKILRKEKNTEGTVYHNAVAEA